METYPRKWTIRGATALLVVLVSVILFAEPKESEAAQTPTQYCPPCVVGAAAFGIPAGQAIGAGVVAGAAAIIATDAIIHAPASTVVVNKPKSEKAQRLKAFARGAKRRGNDLWNRNPSVKQLAKWFKKRFGAPQLIAKFPEAAVGCVIAALVTYVFDPDPRDALKACIGAAAGVYAGRPIK